MTERAKFTVEVLGMPFVVTVTDSCLFSVRHDGDWFQAGAWAELEGKLRRLVKTTRVEQAIELVILQGRLPRRATLRRKKVGTSDTYLFTIDGAPVALQRPNILALGSDLTDQGLEELQKAHAAVVVAESELSSTSQRLMPTVRYLTADRLLAEALQGAADAIVGEASTAAAEPTPAFDVVAEAGGE